MEVSTDLAPSFPTIMSQARRGGNLLFTSGLAPIKPGARNVYGSNIEQQTELTLQNLASVCKAGGASLDNVLKVTIYLITMDNYRAMNEVYKQFFSAPLPARSCVGVSELALPDMLIEIDAVVEAPVK